MTTSGMKTMSTVIISNLIVGNAVLYFGGRSSFEGTPNYPLMVGLSAACVGIYFLFFRFSDYRNYSRLKLFLCSVLCCICIVFLGNFLGLLISQPLGEVLNSWPAAIFMGMLGNAIVFPLSLLIGILNFGIINYFKKIK